MKLLPVVTLALTMSVMASAGPVTTYSVTVAITEDGADNLIFQGSTLSLQHLSLFGPGGVTGGVVTGLTNVKGTTVNPNNPYILVSGTDSANSGLNFTNSDWYDGIQGLACIGDSSAGAAAVLGCPYSLPSAFNYTLPNGYALSDLIGPVSLTVLECAGVNGSVCPGNILTKDPTPFLIQPSSGNGQKATVVIDDVPDSGTHAFKVELTWTVAPEPAPAALWGGGLIALLGLAQLRRRKHNA